MLPETVAKSPLAKGAGLAGRERYQPVIFGHFLLAVGAYRCWYG